MVEGEEVKRYKNIEMPDALKELEIRDFAFNVLTDGKIEFWLYFDHAILPKEWPECRERRTQTPKAVAQAVEEVEAPAMPELVAESVEEEANAPEAEPAAAEETVAPETESAKVAEATEPTTQSPWRRRKQTKRPRPRSSPRKEAASQRSLFPR